MKKEGLEISSLFLSFITLFKIAKSTGIIQLSNTFPQADNATDALDGDHQRGVGQRDATGMSLEQRKEQLLLRDMPSAIAWRKAVGMFPS